MRKGNREALIMEAAWKLGSERNASATARELHALGHDVGVSEVRQVLREALARQAAERAGRKGPVLQAKRELIDMGLAEEFYGDDGLRRTRITRVGGLARVDDTRLH